MGSERRGERRGLDRAAEERPWLVGLALGIPAGLVLAAAGWLPGDHSRTTGEILFGGMIQGLVIGAIVAFGGSWRRRWRDDVERARRRREDAADDEQGPEAPR